MEDSQLGIYSFYWDCGKMGEVEGMFITRIKYVESAVGKQVYFGEILGKHSDIFGTLEEKDLTLKTHDQKFIGQYLEIMEGFKTPVTDGDFINITLSGYNPLEAISEVE